MRTIEEHAPRLGIVALCMAFALGRATFYRRRAPKKHACRLPSLRALSSTERAQVLEILHEPRFCDLAPAEVYATLFRENPARKPVA